MKVFEYWMFYLELLCFFLGEWHEINVLSNELVSALNMKVNINVYDQASQNSWKILINL